MLLFLLFMEECFRKSATLYTQKFNEEIGLFIVALLTNNTFIFIARTVLTDLSPTTLISPASFCSFYSVIIIIIIIICNNYTDGIWYAKDEQQSLWIKKETRSTLREQASRFIIIMTLSVPSPQSVMVLAKESDTAWTTTEGRHLKILIGLNN